MPHEVILYLAGTGTFLAGYVLGRVNRPKRTLEPPKPICSCRHSLSVHDPETKKCKAMIEVDKYVGGGKYGKEWLDCACQQYIGPLPMPDYFAPEITA
jgi:hypothetical protein